MGVSFPEMPHLAFAAGNQGLPVPVGHVRASPWSAGLEAAGVAAPAASLTLVARRRKTARFRGALVSTQVAARQKRADEVDTLCPGGHRPHAVSRRAVMT
jgi:hypothetical protein